MRRKEKRLLQAVALVLAALVLLPNVGLWALYRERQPDGTPGGAGAAVAPAAGQVSPSAAMELGARSPRNHFNLRFLFLSSPVCLLRVSAREASVLPIFLDGKTEAQRKTGICPRPCAI